MSAVSTDTTISVRDVRTAFQPAGCCVRSLVVALCTQLFPLSVSSPLLCCARLLDQSQSQARWSSPALCTPSIMRSAACCCSLCCAVALTVEQSSTARSTAEHSGGRHARGSGTAKAPRCVHTLTSAAQRRVLQSERRKRRVVDRKFQ